MEGQAKKPGVEWQLGSAPLRQQILTDYYLLSYRLLPITEGHSTYSHIRIPSPDFLLKLTLEVPSISFQQTHQPACFHIPRSPKLPSLIIPYYPPSTSNPFCMSPITQVDSTIELPWETT